MYFVLYSRHLFHTSNLRSQQQVPQLILVEQISTSTGGTQSVGLWLITAGQAYLYWRCNRDASGVPSEDFGGSAGIAASKALSILRGTTSDSFPLL